MNTVELLQYALGNALAILEQVTTDLSQEQADWMPPGIANPIGALDWHRPIFAAGGENLA